MNTDGSEEEHCFPFSPEDDDEPATTIAKAVARVKDIEATDLDPLQRTIDAEALNELLTHEPTVGYRSASTPSLGNQGDSLITDLQVSFQYEECAVTVTKNNVWVE